MTTRTDNERPLTRRLVRLGRMYRREVDRALAAHGLTDARAQPVLQIALMGEGVRQGTLADALGIEHPSIVGILDQLCASGLVERQEDPNDRRAKTLHLTEEGRASVVSIETELDGLRARLLSDTDDEDLTVALRVLTRLETALEAGSARRRSMGG